MIQTLAEVKTKQIEQMLSKSVQNAQPLLVRLSEVQALVDPGLRPILGELPVLEVVRRSVNELQLEFDKLRHYYLENHEEEILFGDIVSSAVDPLQLLNTRRATLVAQSKSMTCKLYRKWANNYMKLRDQALSGPDDLSSTELTD